MERLATLARVHESGGLSRAANGDVSRLSQYSRQIKDLEEYFGILLTHKVGRSLELTSEGKRLAALARTHFRSLEEFASEAGAGASVIRVGASTAVQGWFLLPTLKKALPKFPNVRVELVSGRSRELVQSVDDSRIDLALVRASAVHRKLKSASLFKMSYGLYVHQKATTKKMKASEVLSNMPLAVSDGGAFRQGLQDSASASGQELPVALVCPSHIIAAEAVHSGVYAAILPDIVQQANAGKDLIRFDLPFKHDGARTIQAVWRARNTPSVVEKFVVLLSKH